MSRASSNTHTLPLTLLFVAPQTLPHGLRVLSQLYAYILKTTSEVHARPCPANSAISQHVNVVRSLSRSLPRSQQHCHAMCKSSLCHVLVLTLPCMLLLTLVVTLGLYWRCHRFHFLVTIVSTLLTASTATCRTL